MAAKTNNSGCTYSGNCAYTQNSKIPPITTWKNPFRFASESLDAIIVLLAIASGFWVLYCFCKLYKNCRHNNYDNIIKRIKLETENTMSKTAALAHETDSG